MHKLQFLKTLVFPRALQKLQNWVSLSFSSYLKFLFSPLLRRWRLFLVLNLPQWTHLCWFAINLTSKFHVESSSRCYRFWKANLRENYDINSTWKFQRGFEFQNRRIIDEFSTWIFVCFFNVESTRLGSSLYPLGILEQGK